MSTPSNSAATDRPVAAWIALGLAVAMGVAAVRLSRPSDQAASPLPAAASYAPGPSQVPPVRVLVVDPSEEPLPIRISGPYRATAVGDWRVLAQGRDLPETVVKGAQEGLQIGPRVFPAQKLQLQIIRPASLWIGRARYHGDLHLLRHGNDQVAAVNVVDVEEYVADVVAGAWPEGPDEDAAHAAREALAVVARTYALYQMKTAGAENDWDLRRDAEGFSYHGARGADATGDDAGASTATAEQATERTRGIVLVYQGRLFCPFSTAACGGHTVDGQMLSRGAAPPLVGVPCPFCREAEDCQWDRAIPAAELGDRLAEHLRRSGRPIGRLEQIEAPDAPPGTLSEVRVVGSQGETSLPARVFRLQVAGAETLPSPQFTVCLRGEVLEFHGRGRGQGAGLCCGGARRQALDGRTSTEILAYYFPGSELTAVR